MGSIVRTRVVLVALLLVILPAFAIHLPWRPLDLSPGARFASVGVNWQYLTLSITGSSEQSRRSHFEPNLEAGIMVSPRIAVGGWLTTLNAFPEQGWVFTNTPCPSFGASASYMLPVGRWACACANAKAGLTSLGLTSFTRRVGISAGVLSGGLGPVGIGLEAGELWDVITLPIDGAGRTIVARTFSVGLKIQGYSR